MVKRYGKKVHLSSMSRGALITKRTKFKKQGYRVSKVYNVSQRYTGIRTGIWRLTYRKKR